MKKVVKFGGSSLADAGQFRKVAAIVLEEESRLFRGMGGPIQVARYHSLGAEPESIPEELRITARTADGEVMAVEHREYPVYGVQFHPESVLTPAGITIIKNLLQVF